MNCANYARCRERGYGRGAALLSRLAKRYHSDQGNQNSHELMAIIAVARGEPEPARQVFAILIEGIWFAQDSPLEERGFELLVPP